MPPPQPEQQPASAALMEAVEAAEASMAAAEAADEARGEEGADSEAAADGDGKEAGVAAPPSAEAAAGDAVDEHPTALLSEERLDKLKEEADRLYQAQQWDAAEERYSRWGCPAALLGWPCWHCPCCDAPAGAAHAPVPCPRARHCSLLAQISVAAPSRPAGVEQPRREPLQGAWLAAAAGGACGQAVPCSAAPSSLPLSPALRLPSCRRSAGRRRSSAATRRCV